MNKISVFILISLIILSGCRKAHNRSKTEVTSKNKTTVIKTIPKDKSEIQDTLKNSPRQDKIVEGWEKTEIDKANTSYNTESLNDFEKDVILYTNLARLNGRKFCEIYIIPLLKSRPNNLYIKSLIKDLNETNNLPMLLPNSILIKAAEYHATDLGKSGTFEHESTDGTSFSKRMSSFGYNNPAGENLYGGFEDPLGVVVDLLIDEGIKDVGHRKNILDKDFNAIGVSRKPHTKYDYNVVMDFGQD